MVIVYFDGYCNVCNRFIDFLIRHDQKGVLKYAPLQGSTAAKHLPAELRSELSTMVLQEDDKLSTESSAAILSLAYLGGGFRLIKLFLLVPRFLRDGIYRWVANHRYLFAGRRSTCRVPSAEERTRFLE